MVHPCGPGEDNMVTQEDCQHK